MKPNELPRMPHYPSMAYFNLMVSMQHGGKCIIVTRRDPNDLSHVVHMVYEYLTIGIQFGCRPLWQEMQDGYHTKADLSPWETIEHAIQAAETAGLEIVGHYPLDAGLYDPDDPHNYMDMDHAAETR